MSISSHGIHVLFFQIYLCLKKNRTLRPEDEAKYGLYNKEAATTKTSDSNSPTKKFRTPAQMNINNVNSKENYISQCNIASVNAACNYNSNTHNSFYNSQIKNNELIVQVKRYIVFFF